MADPTMAQIDDLERRIRQSNRDDGTFGAAVDDTFELVHSIAAELLAARAEIERLREDGNTTAMDLVDERDEARAEVERLRCRVAVLERVRNEAEWVRKAYELDDNDDQGATDLCAALDAAKETDQ